jgi:hypothetical protein
LIIENAQPSLARQSNEISCRSRSATGIDLIEPSFTSKTLCLPNREHTGHQESRLREFLQLSQVVQGGTETGAAEIADRIAA